jgi:hypothetical protein
MRGLATDFLFLFFSLQIMAALLFKIVCIPGASMGLRYFLGNRLGIEGVNQLPPAVMAGAVASAGSALNALLA